MDQDTQVTDPGTPNPSTDVAAPDDEQQRMAAFEAGLAGKRTTTTPTDEPATPEANEPTAPPAPVYVQITDTELADLRSRVARIDDIEQALKRDRDAIYGTIGGLKQAINSRQTVKLPSKEKIDALRQDLPDLAELFDSIEVASAPTIDPDEIVKRARESARELLEAEKAEALKRKREASVEHLSERHADWQQVGASEQFRSFVASKGEAYAQRIARADADWDWQRLDSAMSEFKAAQKKAADEAAARRGRLQQNIDPRGSAAVSPPPATRDDAFMAGLRKVGASR